MSSWLTKAHTTIAAMVEKGYHSNELGAIAYRHAEVCHNLGMPEPEFASINRDIVLQFKLPRRQVTIAIGSWCSIAIRDPDGEVKARWIPSLRAVDRMHTLLKAYGEIAAEQFGTVSFGMDLTGPQAWIALTHEAPV